jgi:hypothetical protein
MLDTMSQWAKSVPPALALQPAALPAAGASLSGVRLSASQAAASTAPPQWQHIRRTSSASSSGGGSSHGEGSRHGSVAGAAAAGFESRSSSANSSGGGGGGHLSCAQGSRRVSASVLAAAGGVPAIASRLAAGCCKEAPFRELQRLQACYCWVLAHIQVPHGACSEEAGADAVTWDSGLPLFTGGQAHEETQLLQEVCRLTDGRVVTASATLLLQQHQHTHAVLLLVPSHTGAADRLHWHLGGVRCAAARVARQGLQFGGNAFERLLEGWWQSARRAAGVTQPQLVGVQRCASQLAQHQWCC